MYRLWVCLLVTEIVAIAAASRSPRVLATSKGPTMSGTREEAEKTCKEDDSCNEEDAGRKVAGSNPGAGKVFLQNLR